MKILICTPEYPPYGSGIANMVLSMHNEFIKLGHKCTICSPSGPDIKLGSYSMTKKFGGLGILYYWHQVGRYFRKVSNEWDAVWLHDPIFLEKSPFTNATITFHTTYEGYSKMIQNMGGSFPLKFYYTFMRQVEKYSFRFINNDKNHFVCVSPQIITEIVSQGYQYRNTTYIPIGINIKLFQPNDSNKKSIRTEYGIPEGSIALLYVGRLIHQKNLFSLIDTFSKIHEKMPKAFLIICGSGILMEPLKNYISNKEIKDISLLGFVNHDSLPKLYSCSDYFIMASTYEGQPVAMIEAMACGLPPIVSDIPNLKQLVEESKVGLVVKFENPENASLQIVEYLSKKISEDDRNKIQTYVRDNMSSDFSAKKYLQIMGNTGSIIDDN